MEHIPQENILKPVEAKKKGKKKELVELKPILKAAHPQPIIIHRHKNYTNELILIFAQAAVFVLLLKAVQNIIITPLLARFFANE